MKSGANLQSAFCPKSVAVVGVSPRARRGLPWAPDGASFICCLDELDYAGSVYPINSEVTDILGYRTYPTVSSLPEQADLVIIAVPAPEVASVLEDCIKAGAQNILISTAGFDEGGEPEGIALAQEIRKIIAQGGSHVIGPNCMGIYAPASGIGTFDQLPRGSGSVGFISQSDGHLNWYAHYGPNYGIWFSKGVSLGNAYDLDAVDFLEYLDNDPETKIICMYLEAVHDGKRFVRQVQETNRTKPIIIWNANPTELESRAVPEGRISPVANEKIWRGFFRQTGAVQVHSMEEMAETTMTFLYAKPAVGGRVALIGLGGGNSVAATDTCAREGLEVPPLTEKTQNELKKFISPAGTSIQNPLDTGLIFRDVSVLEREIELVASDPQIDMLIIMPHLDMARHTGPKEADRLVGYLSDFAKNNRYGKLAVLVFDSLSNDPWETERRNQLEIELPQKGVPVFGSLVGASRSLARFTEYHRIQREISG